MGSDCSNGCKNIEIFDSIWALMVSFWNSSLLHGAIELLKSEFEIQEFWNVHVSTFTGIDNRWSSLRRWNVRFWMFDNATRLPTNVLQSIFADDSHSILEHACKFFFGLKTSLTANSEAPGMGPKTDRFIYGRYLKNKQIKTDQSRSRVGAIRDI